MTDEVKERLTPKQAIDAGMELLRDFYGEELPGVLLESLELSETEDNWRVSYSFDSGRMRTLGSDVLFSQKKEPIREVRTFEISADDGTFIRLRSK